MIEDHPDEFTRTDPLANGSPISQKQEIIGGGGIVGYGEGNQMILEESGYTNQGDAQNQGN